MQDNTTQESHIEHAPAVAPAKENSLTQTMQAIVELTQHYQDSNMQYAQEIQKYNLEIEKIRLRTEEAMQAKKEDEEAFVKNGVEALYYARLLGESNDAFHQEITSYEELLSDYKESIKVAEYKRIDKQKKLAIKKRIHIIEDQEDILLTQELERLNILTVLTPKRQLAEELQNQLKHLELEKKYYESSKLQQVIQLPTLGVSTEEVIDIETLEE